MFILFKKAFIKSYLLLFILLIQSLYAQSNGNTLLFQGLTNPNPVSVTGMAYGNAYMSRNSNLSSLFYNPAGLTGINTIHISVSSQYITTLERDNQEFYPGNGYLNTSLYLERLIIPDPAWNGIWDDSLGTKWYDKNGNPIGKYWDMNKLKFPVQGKDEYSEDAADNQYKDKDFTFNQISLAYPFKFSEKNFVAAISYYRNYDVRDYDWNGSHLNPHWGTSTIIQANKGDTTRTDWSTFIRKRKGGIYSLTGALAFEYNENLKFGIKFNWVSGKTNDEQILDRIGYFLTLHQLTKWSFSYDTNTVSMFGSSNFSTLNFSIGAIYSTENFSLGINIQLPYTLKREWNYNTQTYNGKSTIQTNSFGTDKVKMPAIYSFGLSIKPNNNLIFSIDYEVNPLNKAEFNLDKNFPDTLDIYSKWVYQYAVRFGIEFSLTTDISIIGGYQYQTASFVPYGVAVRDRGFPEETYSLGVSYKIFHGKIDLAYSNTNLKYYDAYITNRNFTLESSQRIAVGYTFIF